VDEDVDLDLAGGGDGALRPTPPTRSRRVRVELYTRTQCHLCDEAKALIDRVRADTPFELEVIDVDGDPALAARYGEEVPVVLVDGRKHAKYRIDPAALRRRLAGLPDPEVEA
jgi:glutaredoxin